MPKPPPTKVRKATKAGARAAPKASARARAVASPNARFNRPAGPPTRPKQVAPKPKAPAPAPRAAQPGFDLGKTLDQLNPFRKMGSGIGDAMHTGDNQVKKILRK